MKNNLQRWGNWFVAALLALFVFAPVHAEPVLGAFTSGSYQQLLAKHAQQPFMLVVWSLTCPSCVKDLTLISTLHKKWPSVQMVLLSTDDLTAAPQVQAMLSKHGLLGVENALYADDNTQKLNYEIDPDWYGELPRTYFFDARHVRQAVSGVLTEQDYEAQFIKVLQQTSPKH